MHWPSAKVRETFIQYFVRHSSLPHLHAPSSSIVPRNDPSLAFVNAGMNQFKDIILGLGRPPNHRLTNSQKCLRINDLGLVGADTYHHTFFEMLGNWSFANYFKADACAMAWDLLTNVYKLDPQRLYVTYYAGGNNLPVDRETKEIWENMGIPKNRVLPFGSENFWSMGPIGPCGPSTEIHYDHRGTQCEPSAVNGDLGNVVEVWNLVFMQYNRTEKGDLERLPLSHVVDTGAGLERLTAVLNGKVSNYDTDLFLPIFKTVQEISKAAPYSGKFSSDAELDRCYRVYADHIRAVTIALSDGILPQTNHKIRKLIQRAMSVTEKQFLPSVRSHTNLSGFLQESVRTVGSTLSSVYPETTQMESEIQEILSEEVERFLDSLKPLKAGSGSGSEKELLPSLLLMDFPALSRIKKNDLEEIKSKGVLTGERAFKWYDALGISQEASEELCSTLGITFDKIGMDTKMSEVKQGFRDVAAKQILCNSERNFSQKVESFLTLYKPKEIGGVCDPSLKISDENPVFIQWIFNEAGDPLEEVLNSEKSCWVILNKTSFIPGGRTMSSDVGCLVLKDGKKVDVTEVKTLPSGWILHKVANIPPNGINHKAGIKLCEINNSRLFGRELSAQAIYGLQTWLYRHFKVVRFLDGCVSDFEVRLEFTILRGEISLKEINRLQDDLNQQGIPLIVTKRLPKKSGTYELQCVTGISAENAMRHGVEIMSLVNRLEHLCKLASTSAEKSASVEIVNEELKLIRTELTRCLNDDKLAFPYEISEKVEESLTKAGKVLEKNIEFSETRRISDIMASSQNDPFVVMSFESEVEFSSLKKITRVAENRPVLVLIHSSDNFVQGRCCVPNAIYETANMSASDWMSQITSVLGTPPANPPKGQDPRFQVNMKRIRVADPSKIKLALDSAKDFISSQLLKPNSENTDRNISQQEQI